MHTAAPDGSSASLQHLIAHLPEDAVEPIVVSPPGPVVDAFARAGVPVIPIRGVSMLHSIVGMPLRGLRLVELGRTVVNLRHGRALAAAIAETRPDLVHLNERGMLQAAFIARRAGVGVVMHARSVADPRPAWLGPLSRWVISRNVDRVVAIDESVRRSLAPISDAEVVHNPAPLPSRSNAAPATRGAPRSDGVRVLFLANLSPTKGIWDLIAAAERLRDRPDIRFVIAGANGRSPVFHRSLSGRLAHLTGLIPDVESALRRRVADSGLAATVELVGRIDDPSSLIRSSDILAFPSHHDGPGRSVIEAAIEGVPSVVALAHRVEDVVADGETGLIVPPHDPGALAAAIVRLTADPGLRLRLGEAARRRAAATSDPAAVAERVVGIYREVALSRALANEPDRTWLPSPDGRISVPVPAEADTITGATAIVSGHAEPSEPW